MAGLSEGADARGEGWGGACIVVQQHLWRQIYRDPGLFVSAYRADDPIPAIAPRWLVCLPDPHVCSTPNSVPGCYATEAAAAWQGADHPIPSPHPTTCTCAAQTRTFVPPPTLPEDAAALKREQRGKALMWRRDLEDQISQRARAKLEQRVAEVLSDFTKAKVGWGCMTHACI